MNESNDSKKNSKFSHGVLIGIISAVIAGVLLSYILPLLHDEKITSSVSDSSISQDINESESSEQNIEVNKKDKDSELKITEDTENKAKEKIVEETSEEIEVGEEVLAEVREETVESTAGESIIEVAEEIPAEETENLQEAYTEILITKINSIDSEVSGFIRVDTHGAIDTVVVRFSRENGDLAYGVGTILNNGLYKFQTDVYIADYYTIYPIIYFSDGSIQIGKETKVFLNGAVYGEVDGYVSDNNELIISLYNVSEMIPEATHLFAYCYFKDTTQAYFYSDSVPIDDNNMVGNSYTFIIPGCMKGYTYSYTFGYIRNNQKIVIYNSMFDAW